MAGVHTEITGGIIRVGATGFQWGDDFDFVIPFIGDEQRAVLKGLRAKDTRFGTEHAAAVRAELRRLAFTHVGWWRHDGGAPRFVSSRL